MNVIGWNLGSDGVPFNQQIVPALVSTQKTLVYQGVPFAFNKVTVQSLNEILSILDTVTKAAEFDPG